MLLEKFLVVGAPHERASYGLDLLSTRELAPYWGFAVLAWSLV